MKRIHAQAALRGTALPAGVWFFKQNQLLASLERFESV